MENLELWFASKESSLSVRSFSIVEAMSSLFDVSVVARSPDEDLDLDAFLGHGAGFTLSGSFGWSGLVSHMEQVGVEPDGLSTYLIRIVPDLFRTTQRRNCRIFQHQSVPDIAESLLAEWKITPTVELDRASFPALEYRVQYGETDFAFLARLLEEAGISYYFRRAEGVGASPLVFVADPTGAARRPGALTFVDNLDDAKSANVVSKVRLVHEARPGRLTVRDFDFRSRPDFALLAEARAAASVEERHELYQYLPGAFVVEPPGGAARVDDREAGALAKRRLDATRQGRRQIAFRTNAMDLATGDVFSIAGHPRADVGEDARLLLVERRLEGTSEGKWIGEERAVFASDPYRPSLRTPKPRVGGLQSAFVVGPPGEEIHTDELGRVRVQFHWDREGKHDDRSSCWIRVSQGWAGRGFGMMAIPRVGQEVLVDFFEGDPDQPIVVGRVYNSTARPPYKLPELRDRTSWKSDSYPGGGGSNEITFEDAAGKERVFVHAQKDHDRVVEKADKLTVGTTLETNVGTDETHKVGGAQVIDVADTRTATIGQADILVVGEQYQIQIGQTGATFGKDRVTLSTGQASITIAGGDIFFDATGSIQVSSGGVTKLGGSEVHIDGAPNVLLNTVGLTPPVPLPLLAAGKNLLEQALGSAEKAARSFASPLFAEPPGGFDEVALEGTLKKLCEIPPTLDQAPGYLMMSKNINEQLEAQVKSAMKTPDAVVADLKDKITSEKEKLEGLAQGIQARAGELVGDLKGKLKGTVEDLRAKAEAAKQQAVAKFEEMKAKVEAAKGEAKAKLDELKGQFEKLKAEAQGRIEEIKGKLEAAKAQLQAKAAEIKAQAQAKIEELKGKLEAAKAAAKQKLDEIKAKIEDAKAQAKAKLDEMKKRLEDLKEQAKAKFEEMKAQAKALVDQAKEQLEAAKAGVQALKQKIEDAKEQVKAKIEEIKGQIEEIKAQAKAMVEDLKAQAKAVIDQVEQKIEDAKQMLENVKSEAKHMFDDAKQSLKDAKDQAKQLAKDVKQQLGDAKQQAKDLLKDAKEQGKDFLKDAKEQGKDALEDAKKQLGDAKGDAKSWFDQAKEQGEGAMKDAAGPGGGQPLPTPAGPLGSVVSRSGGLTGQDVASALNKANGPTFFQTPGEGQLLVMRAQGASPIQPGDLSSHLVDSQMKGIPTQDAFADALKSKGYVVYERPWGDFGEAFVKKGAGLAAEAV